MRPVMYREKVFLIKGKSVIPVGKMETIKKRQSKFSSIKNTTSEINMWLCPKSDGEARGRELEETDTAMSTREEDRGRQVWTQRRLRPAGPTRLTAHHCLPNSLRAGQKRHLMSPHTVHLMIQDGLRRLSKTDTENSTSRQPTPRRQKPKIKGKSRGPGDSRTDDSNDSSLLGGWGEKSTPDFGETPS